MMPAIVGIAIVVLAGATWLVVARLRGPRPASGVDVRAEIGSIRATTPGSSSCSTSIATAATSSTPTSA